MSNLVRARGRKLVTGVLRGFVRWKTVGKSVVAEVVLFIVTGVGEDLEAA